MQVNWLLHILVAAALGLVLGYFVSRRSEQQKPIKGGDISRILHYLGASAFVSVAPTVLVAAIFWRYPILTNLLAAAVTLLLAFVLLVGYAYYEQQASKSGS